MLLKRLLPGGFPRKSKVEDRDSMGVVQVAAYTFPPLEECRAFFESLAGLDGFDWEAGAVRAKG
jgi:hypothetical protein